jgi:hypothetical protein
LAGNSALARLMLQRAESSFPEGAEAQLANDGDSIGADQTTDIQSIKDESRTDGSSLQRTVDGSVGPARPARWPGGADAQNFPPVQRAAHGGVSVQRVGGAVVGRLCVRSNVISAGLTAGHAWLSYTPNGGSETTYGTWGNRRPIGLHRDLEVGFGFAASRCTDLDATDKGALDSFAAGNNAWSLLNNCASFAARGWQSVTMESLDYTSMGIPNPSALGAGISAANGGPIGVLAPAGAPAGAGSSSL